MSFWICLLTLLIGQQLGSSLPAPKRFFSLALLHILVWVRPEHTGDIVDSNERQTQAPSCSLRSSCVTAHPHIPFWLSRDLTLNTSKEETVTLRLSYQLLQSCKFASRYMSLILHYFLVVLNECWLIWTFFSKCFDIFKVWYLLRSILLNYHDVFYNYTAKVSLLRWIYLRFLESSSKNNKNGLYRNSVMPSPSNNSLHLFSDQTQFCIVPFFLRLNETSELSHIHFFLFLRKVGTCCYWLNCLF